MTDLINLPQLELEIKFYLGQTAQNIIEVGKRLIAAKALVAHGQWQQWLQNNFQLTDRTARRFMQISEQFSKTVDVDRFKPSQMAELLALPDAERYGKSLDVERFKPSQLTEMLALPDAERYGNLQTSANSESIPILKTTQMIALLSLPDAEETEKFIAEVHLPLILMISAF